MPSFLDLPRETRDRIYRFLLVKNTGSRQALEVTNTTSLSYIPHPNCPAEFSHGASHPTKWRFSSPKLVNIGSTAILRTCKRIAEEGAEVLYGSSRFLCTPDYAFHEEFLPVIGPFNSSCIRSVHLSMDTFFNHDMIRTTTPQFEGRLHDSTGFLVNLLSQNLSQLQELVLAIPVGRHYHLNLNSGLLSSKIWWVRAHCSMLWLAAWTTIRHPRLKRAVWSQRWIDRYTPDAEEDLQYLDISVRVTAPGTKWDIRHGGEFTELAWYVCRNLVTKGLPLQSIQGITFDSRAIRRQGVGGLKLDHDPLSYGADAAAVTSEEGLAQILLEDISDRFGYKKGKDDGVTGVSWGDLQGSNAQRWASEDEDGAEVAKEARHAT